MALALVGVDTGALVIAIAIFGRVTPNTFILVGLALWLLALGHHYRPRLQLSILDEVTSVAGRVVVAISLGAGYRELVSGHDVFTVDRLWVLIGAVGSVLIGRVGTYSVLRHLRRIGPLQQRAAIIGSPETLRLVSEAITMNPECGLTVGVEPAPIDGDGAGGPEVDVVIAEVADGHDPIISNLARCRGRRPFDIYLLPSALVGYPALVPGADSLGSMPLLPLGEVALRSLRWKVKRLLDVVIGIVLLVVTAPVVTAAALRLWIEDGPGVLFRQERIGYQGRSFVMLKLRTIRPDRVGNTDAVWNVDDAAISRFARFCRATSIDELPQLWNVVAGDMSLVGPRPERPHFVAEFSESVPGYEGRHRVPAGLTGLAQVNGLRGDTSIPVRARFDNAYIDNWSLDQDVKILARTITSILTRRGRGS